MNNKALLETIAYLKKELKDHPEWDERKGDYYSDIIYYLENLDTARTRCDEATKKYNELWDSWNSMQFHIHDHIFSNHSIRDVREYIDSTERDDSNAVAIDTLKAIVDLYNDGTLKEFKDE